MASKSIKFHVNADVKSLGASTALFNLAQKGENIIFPNITLWKCNYFEDYKKKSDLASLKPRLTEEGNQIALANEGKLFLINYS